MITATEVRRREAEILKKIEEEFDKFLQPMCDAALKILKEHNVK